MKKTYDFDSMSLYDITVAIIMDNELCWKIYSNMKTYGGSFVKALAECLLAADAKNKRALVDAFISYFIEYQPKNWTTDK